MSVNDPITVEVRGFKSEPERKKGKREDGHYHGEASSWKDLLEYLSSRFNFLSYYHPKTGDEIAYAVLMASCPCPTLATRTG